MDLLLELENFAGEAKYQKFVQTLNCQARVSGRLMTWQEVLLYEFSQTLGIAMPTDLESVLSLYRRPAISFERDASGPQSELIVLGEPVVRIFHWVNQVASGGSHATVFTVDIATTENPRQIVLLDRAAPHQDPPVADAIMSELAEGIKRFLLAEYADLLPFHGLSIALRDFSYHEIDLNPRKFAPAIMFVLAELVCEMRCNRTIPVKRLGIPI